MQRFRPVGAELPAQGARWQLRDRGAEFHARAAREIPRRRRAEGRLPRDFQQRLALLRRLQHGQRHGGVHVGHGMERSSAIAGTHPAAAGRDRVAAGTLTIKKGGWMSVLTESKAWQALRAHHAANKQLSMRSLFEEDGKRFERFSMRFDDMLLDYSKNLVTEQTMALLFALARQAEVEHWRDRMLAGEKINFTEHRAVLHTALRAASDPGHAPIMVDGKD